MAVPIVEATETVKAGQTVTITIDAVAGAEYIWTVGGVEVAIDEPSLELAWTDEGIYEVTAQYRVNGCMSPVSSMEFEVVPADEPVIDIYPEPEFSPNGDGINDTWDIVNIDRYPEAKIEIYDRFHKRLVVFTGEELSQSGWDGRYNGHELPSTDYWYYIRCHRLGKSRTGHFILKR